MRVLLLFVLAIFEGFALSLSIPNIEIGILPFIALLPSFFIIRYTKTYKGAFFLGWVVGITGVFSGYNWLIHTITTFGGSSIPDWLATPIFLLYCIVFSLKFAFFHVFTKLVDKNLPKIPILLTFPIILTASEFLMPELFPFFFGNLMHKDILAMQIIEITGIIGMTFFMGLANSFIFTILSFFFQDFTKSKKRKDFPYLSVSITFVVFLVIHLFGYFRMQHIEHIDAETKDTLKVGLIQPNTPMPLENFSNELVNIETKKFEEIKNNLTPENQYITKYYSKVLSKEDEKYIYSLSEKGAGPTKLAMILNAFKTNLNKMSVEEIVRLMGNELNATEIETLKLVEGKYFLTKELMPEEKQKLIDILHSVGYKPDYITAQESESKYAYSKRRSIELTYEILEKDNTVDLIIWPEAAAPFFYIGIEDDYVKKIKEIVGKYDTFIYANDFDSAEYSEKDYKTELEFAKILMKEDKYKSYKESIENGSRKLYNIYNNSDLIAPPDGRVLDSYRKVFLLAFGEYNPFKNTFIEKIIPALRTFMDGSGISNVVPGNEKKVLTFTKDGKTISFAPQICYEIIVPEFTREFTSKDANLLINITNDRWFGEAGWFGINGKATRQHALLGSARAIENRMYLIRSTNSGMSEIVSPTGKKVPFYSKANGENATESPIYDEDYIIAEVKPLKIDTFYKSFGDVFGWVVSGFGILGVLIAIIMGIINRKR